MYLPEGEATSMPKSVEGGSYNSFVFSDGEGEFDGRNCQIGWVWPTSAKGGGFRQQGLTGGTPAHVGETIVLFGTGFGATQPPISATALVTTPLPLAHPEEFSVRIVGPFPFILYAGVS